MREYSRFETLVNNLPYILMVSGGSALLMLAVESALWSWLAAGAYAAYGIVGALWIMVFVCPYCMYYDNPSCPCGYGKVSAKLRQQGAAECFSRKFKRHIPVIVPLWFIPVVATGIVLANHFSWSLLILGLAFAVHSFVILPLVSTRHGCADCPQKDACPWMRGKS